MKKFHINIRYKTGSRELEKYLTKHPKGSPYINRPGDKPEGTVEEVNTKIEGDYTFVTLVVSRI